jgi:hypothetical protein
MRGNSTLNLLRYSAFAFSIFLAGHSFAQSPDLCSEITANFNTTTNGFSSPDGEFTHIVVGGDGYFAKSFPRDFNSAQEFELLSPTYANSSPFGSVVYGFTLSGYIQGTDYQVDVLNSAGQVLVSSERRPVNPNPNANNQNTRVCEMLTAVNPSLLPNGGAVKYHIYIFSPDPRGNGGQDVTVEFDDFSVGNIAGIILPVNFVKFHAKKVASGTQLNWDVAEEINVSKYEVQKGNNGADFKTIGYVIAGDVTSYAFTDANTSQGVSFYRIRSVDLDGKFKFSTVISFANGRSAALLRAFPLPAQNQVTLQHGAIDGKAQISLASEDGRTVRRLVPAVGSMQTAIDLTGLKAGLYLLRLENSNGEIETLKLLKQ